MGSKESRVVKAVIAMYVGAETVVEDILASSSRRDSSRRYSRAS